MLRFWAGCVVVEGLWLAASSAVMVGVSLGWFMADDQVTVDPEFSPQPDGVWGRGFWLVPVAGVAVAAFLFGWLMGSGTSGESDATEAAPSMIAAPSVETTPTTEAAVPSTTVSPATTVPPTSISTSSTTEPLDPLSWELVVGEDLRAASSGLRWATVPIDDAFWDPTVFNGVTIRFCVDPTLMLSESPWKLTATSPLIELDDRPVTAVFQTGGSGVQEVLYAGEETMVAAAFDALVAGLEVCLDTFDPSFLFVDEYVEYGWHWVASRYEMPPVGDESYAIRFRAMGNDEAVNAWLWGSRLAVVRSVDRIVIVNSWRGDADEPLSDSEFNEVVQIAVDRLWDGIEVTVEGIEGRAGGQLAGVLFDADGRGIGGFAVRVDADPFSATELVRTPGVLGHGTVETGLFPYVTEEVLVVEPGTYTLMLWLADNEITPYSWWVPDASNVDLEGCETVVEVEDGQGASLTVTGGFAGVGGGAMRCTIVP